MKSAFLKFEHGLNLVSLTIAGLMLLVAVVMGMTQVVMRFVFEQPSEWSEVLVRFSLIWMVFMGIPAAFRLGSMVSVDLMRRKSGPRFQRVLDFVIMAATLVLLGFIAWFGWDYALRGRVQTVIGMESLSMFWAYLALPVGAVCAMAGAIGNFLDPRHQELETAT
jgi:TRAP-type C4-dicarboxylate transport system permease small subunit